MTRQNGGNNAPQPDGLFQPELHRPKPDGTQRPDRQHQQGTYQYDFSFANQGWGSLGESRSDRQPESSCAQQQRPSNPPVEADPYAGALDWSWPSPPARKSAEISTCLE